MSTETIEPTSLHKIRACIFTFFDTEKKRKIAFGVYLALISVASTFFFISIGLIATFIFSLVLAIAAVTLFFMFVNENMETISEREVAFIVLFIPAVTAALCMFIGASTLIIRLIL